LHINKLICTFVTNNNTMKTETIISICPNCGLVCENFNCPKCGKIKTGNYVKEVKDEEKQNKRN
jgi:rubrerythrin